VPSKRRDMFYCVHYYKTGLWPFLTEGWADVSNLW
jgi:hypothetical protein